jgi:kumamolisin
MELKSYIKRHQGITNNSATTITASEEIKTTHPRTPPHETPIAERKRVPEIVPQTAPKIFRTVGQRPLAGIGPNAINPRDVNYVPTQMAKYYSFPNTTGVGTKVAVIELGGGFVQSDLDKYFASMGLKVKPVIFHSIDGAKNAPGDPDGADGEVMLDLCIVGSMAPATELHCYMAPNSESGFLHAIEQAVADKMTAISISWGAAEELWNPSYITRFNDAFQKAADAGITVTAAAGDSGSSNGLPGNNVDFPASSPLVLGCGGTSVPTLNTGSEMVWNDGGGIATGGGLSELFAIPSYQTNVNVPGARFRGVPDVAGNADPSTGWSIIVDGKYYVIGGTSAVSPMWAALAACLTEALGTNVGFLNAALYSLKGWSRDILIGNNGTYSARASYDCCTGMGVPVGTKLLAALKTIVATPAPTPTPAPTTPDPVTTPTAPTATTTTHTIVVTGTGTVITVNGKAVE